MRSVSTSPGRGQPSQFYILLSRSRANQFVYVPKHRTAPKVMDHGLSEIANSAEAVGKNKVFEFNDKGPAPKKQQ